jgi:hypothetical protein
MLMEFPPFLAKDWVFDPDNLDAVKELMGFTPDEGCTIKKRIKPTYRSLIARKGGHKRELEFGNAQ